MKSSIAAAFISMIIIELSCGRVAVAQETEWLGRALEGSAGKEMQILAPIDNFGEISPVDMNVARASKVLERVLENIPIKFRGAKEVKLFKDFSSSVVLVVTNEGLGSGTLVNANGLIITAWHVIAGYREVGVIFQPKGRGAAVDKNRYILADVVKVDEVRDLALLQLRTPPKVLNIMPLGSEADIQIGADVHAIGHPTGEAWTYTKGTISQFRRRYKWSTQQKVEHQADVIQTQTPISPGNSGGPLISDQGRMLGVNAFKASGESLNFSVSIEDVKRFINSRTKYLKANQAKPRARKCAPRTLSKSRSTKKPEVLIRMDLNCDGKTNAIIVIPDDQSKGIQLRMDKNGNGKIDTVIIDKDRDKKWDLSLWDTDGDGKPDLIGVHPDGRVKPSSFRPYA